MENPAKYAQAKWRNCLRQRELRSRRTEEQKMTLKAQERERMRRIRQMKKLPSQQSSQGGRVIVIQSPTSPPAKAFPLPTTMTSEPGLVHASPSGRSAMKIAVPQAAHTAHTLAGPFVAPSQSTGLAQESFGQPLSFVSPSLLETPGTFSYGIMDQTKSAYFG